MALTSVPNEPVTFVTIPASFGNSRARTSLNVPAPPDNNWNPSTTFGTMPMILLAVFPKPTKYAHEALNSSDYLRSYFHCCYGCGYGSDRFAKCLHGFRVCSIKSREDTTQGIYDSLGYRRQCGCETIK